MREKREGDERGEKARERDERIAERRGFER